MDAGVFAAGDGFVGWGGGWWEHCVGEHGFMALLGWLVGWLVDCFGDDCRLQIVGGLGVACCLFLDASSSLQ